MQTATKKNSVKLKGFHTEEQEVVFDMICGMEIKLKDVKFWVDYKGETYYFCSENCKDHFKGNPKMYLGK